MTFELTDEMIAKWPSDAQAVIRLLLARITELEAQAAELRSKTPQNSSQPPSTTHPHAKPPSVKPKSKRSQGGQPGHDKHERTLIPVEECQDLVPCVPRACRRCGQTLTGRDPAPLRHQVWELPDIRPIVTEYQRHRLICACGSSTCGDLPPGVPTGQAGPRLIAFSGLLMACFRQSKRRAAQFLSMILNQPGSAAWMVLLQNRCADAVQGAYDELATQLPAQVVLNIDESPTKEGPTKGWIWTVVATTFTFFACRTSRAADVLQDLLGEAYDGIIHCDRARMYWRFGRLQWCWALLKRDFQALVDDPCRTKQRLGCELMRPTKKLFALWKWLRDGTITRGTFERRLKPIRQEIYALLLRGYFNALKDLYLTSFGGTLYRFNQSDGAILSAKQARATSAPVIVGKDIFFTRRADDGHGKKVEEALVTADRATANVQLEAVRKDAPHLDVAVQAKSQLAAGGLSLDSSNGFAAGAPGSANASAAFANIGQGNVSTLQAYQGSRVLNAGNTNFNCMGDQVLCTDAASGKIAWSLKLEGDMQKEGGYLAAPPAAAGGQIFLATLKGEVLQLEPAKGTINHRYSVGTPLRFQPTIQDGRIYVGTQDGQVVCIDTGDKKLTGWSTWGGNSAHTGIREEAKK